MKKLILIIGLIVNLFGTEYNFSSGLDEVNTFFNIKIKNETNTKRIEIKHDIKQRYEIDVKYDLQYHLYSKQHEIYGLVEYNKSDFKNINHKYNFGIGYNFNFIDKMVSLSIIPSYEFKQNVFIYKRKSYFSDDILTFKMKYNSQSMFLIVKPSFKLNLTDKIKYNNDSSIKIYNHEQYKNNLGFSCNIDNSILFGISDSVNFTIEHKYNFELKNIVTKSHNDNRILIGIVYTK